MYLLGQVSQRFYRKLAVNFRKSLSVDYFILEKNLCFWFYNSCHFIVFVAALKQNIFRYEINVNDLDFT